MSEPRFHISFPLPASGTVVLPDAVAHHAVRVRRLRDGQTIVLFNGMGGEYHARLHIDGRTASAAIDRHVPVERELPGQMTLAQGLASGDRMDWIIEKSVELGVTTFVPVAARRSVLQLEGKRLEKRLEHWQRLIASASEQCGRNRLMDICAPVSLETWLASPAMPGPEDTLLCHPKGSVPFTQALAHAPRQLCLLVGPEGGWSDEEQAAAHARGAKAVQLGKRVLRTETAGVAMTAAALTLLGWW